MATLVGTSVEADATASATSIAAPSKNVTTGNALIATITWENGNTLSSVTDSEGNSWTIARQETYSGGEPSVAIAYSMNVTGDAALVVTANFSGSCTIRSICVEEWSGLTSSSPVDDSDYSEASSGTSFSTPTLTLTQAGVVVAVVAGYSTWSNATAGGTPTFTLDTASYGLTNFSTYYIASSSGSVTPGASWDGSSDRWMMLAVAFKDAAGGGGTGAAANYYRQAG